MPTSSQSLILQTTNGQLPPFFGRRVWRPELPPGPEWTSSEYPMSTVQIKHGYIGTEHKRYNSKRKAQSLKRAGSAPELFNKVDFSTLPMLLKIRGLHGTVRYDTDAKYVSWKINSIGPFYDRMNARGRFTAANESTPGTLRYFHADRPGHTLYGRDVDAPMDYTYRPVFKKQVQFFDPTSFSQNSNPILENITKDDIFMSMEETDGKIRMIRTDLKTADYFKLIQVGNQSDESNDSERIEPPLFRLERCRPADVGCFRLAPTDPREVGDYKLVPPPGYLADDFRLVPSSEMQGAFVLLQSDAGNPGQYLPVLRNKDASGEFRMVQAKIQQTMTDQSKMDVIVPREAWGENCPFWEHQGDDENKDIARLKNKEKQLFFNENRYNYFDDVRQQYEPIENEYTLPDISLHESHGNGVLHHQPQSVYSTNRASTFDNDLMAFNQHLEEFNQRYTDSLRQNPPHDPKRPVHQSFRNAKVENMDRKKTSTGTGSSTKLLSSDWKTHNFDPWSRTTKHSRDELLSSANVGLSRNIPKMPALNLNEKDIFEEDSLLEEEKFKANYKQWKKRKVKTLRMRKELPPSDPAAVCIRFGNTDLSHDELKVKIEKETGQDLVSLQFDPVSVHSIDPEATSRWIVKFSGNSICEYLAENGIRINGMKFQVRKLDDVMKEEHEAYKLYKTMKELTEKKTRRTASRKDMQKPKMLKTTQTQTNKQEV